MLKLAAFADEISPDLDEQIRVCKDNDVHYFELRGVSNMNVMDFDKAMCNEIRTRLSANGMAVACIGSPIGKVKINDPWPAHFDRFKHAVDLAEFFGAGLLRIFSYYPPEKGQQMRQHRDEVMRRMQAKADYVNGRNVTLVHENEADIYGERAAECVDLLKTINSPKLRNAFDFANFVVAKQHPLDNWPQLKPFTVHIHVKDARLSDGGMVPAGKGDGQIEPILADAYQSGYRGFLTLEPHLAAAGQFSGFSGPGMFKVAADALKAICQRNDIPLGT